MSKEYNKYLGKTTSAYELLDLIEKDGFSIKTPVDIEGIYKHLEITFSTKPNFTKMQITGSILIEGNEPYVWVNPFNNTHSGRKRFTLAHELGHFMLHIAPNGDLTNAESIEDENISFNRDDNWSFKEMEANNFATQILMPVRLLEKELKCHFNEKPTLEEAVEKLASIFEVSMSAMEYRLKRLGLRND